MGRLKEVAVQQWAIEDHEMSRLRCEINTTITYAVRDFHKQNTHTLGEYVAKEVLGELPRLLEEMGIVQA